jgi:2-methylisocitrate lyase-like PEP mutase family enzyme
MSAPQAGIVRGLSRVSPAERRARLAARLREERLLSAPGVFEMVSAKIADRMGFEALYMTGYGTVASYLGLPDAGLASYADMVNRVQQFASITVTPMICDADTGYGGLLNVMHTVRGYEAAGACAIQLEDQEFPKKCGHMLGRRVIAAEAMAEKIRVAVESRSDPNFLIIARTDARTTLGLDEALRRAELYAKAGADLLFVESPESVEEMARIGQSFDLPLVANMVEGGRTPVLSREELQSLGYRLAIFPAAAFLAAGAAFEGVYRGIQENGSTVGTSTPMYEFQQFSQLMGFDWVSQFDQDHSQS